MKRTIPLLITAVGGFVLVFSFFIPATEGWGEVVAIWFDILAAIAFILGGGNLLKVQLKKISDRTRGWAYAVVTLVAFLVTLVVGLTKWGSSPAPIQEFYGETFAELRLEDFPAGQVARLAGQVPRRADGEGLPLSVQRQLAQGTDEQGQPELVFRGWMLPHQRDDLKGYDSRLEWRCRVETLFDRAQPPQEVRAVVRYRADHEALSYSGPMSDEHRDLLLGVGENPRWKQAVEELHRGSNRVTRVRYEVLPERLEIPEAVQRGVFIEGRELVARGPVSPRLRDDLARKFPRYRLFKPVGPDERTGLLDELQQRGPSLSEAQLEAFHKVLDGAWTVEQLQIALDAAGQPAEEDKTACEMLEEVQTARAAGRVPDVEPTRMVGEPTTLNQEQLAVLEQFAADPDMNLDELAAALRAAGEFTDRQRAALDTFFAQVQTVAERDRLLWQQLERADPRNPLHADQREFLLADFREQQAWRATVSELFQAAHVTKYSWSGAYRDQGNPFWWIFEFLFKPLTATMFAMLAFYVASAAFRAFRAKNVEAFLLLGTAFIILLGRTFAGVYLTGWLPDELAGLRIENLSMFIMSVFNTAGNRAIMIGIALGIASTSLKVLLGIDRSYLGSREG